MGLVSSSIGDYQEAVKYGLKAVQTAEALKDSSMQLCTIYNRVGLSYYQLKQYQKAHVYFKKSLFIAQKYNDQSTIYYLNGNIGSLLINLNRIKEGLTLFLYTAKKYPPQTLGDSITLTSWLFRAYAKLKQYASAQKYCNQLIAFSNR
jgi:tetratricopeptide (TPR) repeat protein